MWEHFGLVFCEETKTVIPGFIVCRDCSKVYRYSPRSGTSNVLSHLRSHKTHQQPLTMDNFVIMDSESLNISNEDKTKLLRAAVQFVTKDLRPFVAIECEGITDLLYLIWNLGGKHGSISREDLQKAMPSAVTVSRQVCRTAIY